MGILDFLRNQQKPKSELELLHEEFEKNDKKFQKGLELNKKAMEYEQQGNIDQAVKYYEKAVSVGFIGSHPYQQLTKMYLQQKQYSDVIRVINAYRNTLSDNYFETSTEGKMIWFRNQLANAQNLNKKEVD